MTTYANSHAQFDCAIDGVPFFLGPSPQYPLMRQTSDFKRQQIDQTTEPGEQSLTTWWYRSQVSFHLGAGLKFFDPVRGNPTSQFRFWDSAGVNVWTQGEVSLLRKTVQKYTMTTWGSICSYYYGSENGILVEDGTALKKVPSSGASSTLSYRSSGSATIKDIATSGNYAFIVDNDGVWRWKLAFSGNGTKIYSFPGSIDRARAKWIKERLFVAADATLYELSAIPGSPPKALPADYTTNKDYGRLLYTHPETDWKWTAIEAGPDCVFFAGYAGETGGAIFGNRSVIYASTVEVANIDDVPQVTQPSVVGELPDGEYIRSMISYADTYLVLGTTKGVRVCQIGSNGAIAIGPLSIESDDRVSGLTAWGQYVFAGGADVDGYWGTYRLDLSAPVDQSGMRFAWAKDVASGQASNSGNVARLAMLGNSGRLAVMCNGSGLWLEDATDKVPSGWLQTGLIRMDTWTDKVYAYLRTVVDPTQYGSIRPYWLTETATATALAADTSTFGVVKLDTDGSDGVPRLGLSYKWVLTRYGSDVTKGPVFQGYQARSLPANVVQREIRLPLLCYRREQLRSGRTVERSVWDRIEAVEALERSGKVITYQDFLTGETRLVTVASVQYVSDRPSQSRAEGANPGGMLVVTLRSAD